VDLETYVSREWFFEGDFSFKVWWLEKFKVPSLYLRNLYGGGILEKFGT